MGERGAGQSLESDLPTEVGKILKEQNQGPDVPSSRSDAAVSGKAGSA